VKDEMSKAKWSLARHGKKTLKKGTSNPPSQRRYKASLTRNKVTRTRHPLLADTRAEFWFYKRKQVAVSMDITAFGKTIVICKAVVHSGKIMV